MKIIDAHVHVYSPEIEKNRDKIAATERWFDILSGSPFQKWGTAEDLIAAMDRDGIETSIVTGFAFYDQGLCREVNDYVLDAAKRYPGRILPMAVVSPTRPGAEAEIARCAELGAVGVGELFPDGQLFDISDARQTWRLAGACGERGLFVMFHTAEQVGHQYPGKGAYGAEHAAKFCLNHPEAEVIFAHFGGGLWAYEAMPEMRQVLSNAWYDTAAWPWLYGPQVMDSIFAIGAGHKILYGSDWTILAYPRYAKLLSETNLDEKMTNALLYENIGRLLSRSD